MPFRQCYYHIIWATKGRERAITPAVEIIVRQQIRYKTTELKCELLAFNAVEDHVHVALAIPPSLSVAHVIGELKGSSSHAVNSASAFGDYFHWQGSYGVLTVSPKDLQFLYDYIAQQKEHHAAHTTLEALERMDIE